MLKYLCLFFLECGDGYFGLNCIELCNIICRSCNKMIGICDFGCYFGWKGFFCYESIFINICYEDEFYFIKLNFVDD